MGTMDLRVYLIVPRRAGVVVVLSATWHGITSGAIPSDAMPQAIYCNPRIYARPQVSGIKIKNPNEFTIGGFAL